MDEQAQTPASALEAWAATVMSGDDVGPADRVGEVDRAPGHAHYDPADVISVFASASKSCKQRNDERRGDRPELAEGDVAQPE